MTGQQIIDTLMPILQEVQARYNKAEGKLSSLKGAIEREKRTIQESPLWTVRERARHREKDDEPVTASRAQFRKWMDEFKAEEEMATWSVDQVAELKALELRFQTLSGANLGDTRNEYQFRLGFVYNEALQWATVQNMLLAIKADSRLRKYRYEESRRNREEDLIDTALFQLVNGWDARVAGELNSYLHDAMRDAGLPVDGGSPGSIHTLSGETDYRRYFGYIELVTVEGKDTEERIEHEGLLELAVEEARSLCGRMESRIAAIEQSTGIRPRTVSAT